MVSFFLPPRTNPLVAMADVESPVMVVTTVAMATIKQERAVKESIPRLLYNREHYINGRQAPRDINHLNTFNTKRKDPHPLLSRPVISHYCLEGTTLSTLD